MKIVWDQYEIEKRKDKGGMEGVHLSDSILRNGGILRNKLQVEDSVGGVLLNTYMRILV